MTGVCHGCSDQETSVDDEKPNPDGAWRVLGAWPRKSLAILFARLNGQVDLEDLHVLLAASGCINPTHSPAALVQGAIRDSGRTWAHGGGVERKQDKKEVKVISTRVQGSCEGPNTI